jgi:hypothetical protein
LSRPCAFQSAASSVQEIEKIKRIKTVNHFQLTVKNVFSQPDNTRYSIDTVATSYTKKIAIILHRSPDGDAMAQH